MSWARGLTRNGIVVGNRGLGVVALLLVSICVMAGQAAANMTISTPGPDMTTMGTYAGTILAALAGVWLVRKFVKTSNRS